MPTSPSTRSDGTILKLMFQPGAERRRRALLFRRLGAADPRRRSRRRARRARQRGILQRLSDACIWDAANRSATTSPTARIELLTSIIPIRTAAGCWVLTSTHATSEFLNTSIGRPYWETPGDPRSPRRSTWCWRSWPCWSRSASASACGAFATSPPRSARAASATTPSATATSSPSCRAWRATSTSWSWSWPRVSQQIRQSAEDKAHSFKTPLAAIRSALEPVRRAVPLDNLRARRALEIVDSSINSPARSRDRRPTARHQHRRPDRSAAPCRPTSRSSSPTPRCTSARSWPARTSGWSAGSTSTRSCAPGQGMLEVVAAERAGERHQLLAAGQHDRRHADGRRRHGRAAGRRRRSRRADPAQDRPHVRALLLVAAARQSRMPSPGFRACRPRPLDRPAQRRGPGRPRRRRQPHRRGLVGDDHPAAKQP